MGEIGRVWLVEDEDLLRETIRGILESGGYTVMVDRPTRETLPALIASPFDVLVTDIMMPGVDGMELIRALRKARPRVGIVAISGGTRALGAEPALQASLAMGAAETLFKPFKPDELLAAVARVRRDGKS